MVIPLIVDSHLTCHLLWGHSYFSLPRSSKSPLVLPESNQSFAITTINFHCLCQLLYDKNVYLKGTFILWCGNVYAISSASNPSFHAWTKHIENDSLCSRRLFTNILLFVLSPSKIKWLIYCSLKLLFQDLTSLWKTHHFSTLMCFWENIILNHQFIQKFKLVVEGNLIIYR